ncbi:tetratricopeptide repeat protein [Flavobacterium subsaxonicum]|nr:hypothetical protein [Flavobacterium subsaxonicum]
MCLLLCLAAPAFAQGELNLDTLTQQAGKELYTNPDKAIKLALKIYDLSEGDTQHQIASLIIVSNGYFSLKKGKEAKKYAFKAIELAQTTNDYVNQVKLYGLLGNHYQVLKINDKARLYLNKAEEILQQHPMPPDMAYLKGNIYAVKGNSYKNDLDCDFAITYFDKAINEFKHTQHKSASTNLRLVMVQKGFCLLEKQMPNEATAIFNEAIKNTSATQYYDTWVYAKIGLSKSLAQKQQYNLAIIQLTEALNGSPKDGQVEIKNDLYRNLSDNYLKLDDLNNYRKYNSRYHETLVKATANKEHSFNWLANDLTDDANEQLQATRTTYKIYAIAAAATGLVLLFLIAVAIKKNQKKAAALKQQLFRKTLNSQV